MGRRVTLSSVIFLTLIMVNPTSFEDKYERHVGRCDWVCKIDVLNFGEDLRKCKKQGTTFKAEVQYKQNRVANPQINHSSNIFAEVWMALIETDNVFQSHGSLRLVNSTLMQIVLSGQFISREYRELAISCIKLRSRNLFLNYSTDLKDPACEWHQPPLLDGRARDSSNHVSLMYFFGYLWTDKNSRVFAGFVNSKDDKHSEKRNSYEWEFYLICTVFTLYYPGILALFCTTDITCTVPVRAAAVRADEGSTENPKNPEESSHKSLSRRHSRKDFTIAIEDDNRNFVSKEEDRMTVHLMNINGLNPMGFRSFTTRKVFSSTGYHDKCRKSVKVVVLALFPLTIPLLLDLYFLLIPITASSMPYNHFSTSVVCFVYEKCPYMLIFFFIYFIRCCCLCFSPATSIWAPSFVCRKHLSCAVYNNYCVQLFFMCFPRCDAISFSSCDECKRTSDCPEQCEVPENIQHNLQVQTQTFVKHWRYCKEKFNATNEKINNFFRAIRAIFFFVILVGVYALLVLTDFMFSFPIISVCYGRMWVTGGWLEKPQFHYRIILFLCHVLEFFIICGSVTWVIYFSYCTSLVVEIAISSVKNTLVTHPVRIKYLIVVTVFWHSLLSLYNSFISKYDDLIMQLYKSYKASYEKHNDKVIHYKQRGILTIPKVLFDKAYKQMPSGVKQVICRIICFIVVWYIFFAGFRQMDTNTTNVTKNVLIVGSSFIAWAHPWIINMIINKEKKTEEAVLEEVVADVVNDYITDLTERLG